MDEFTKHSLSTADTKISMQTVTVCQLKGHERMPRQSAWLYQAVVVAGEEVSLVISKGGKDFSYLLQP
jgi:hypothetical protein